MMKRSMKRYKKTYAIFHLTEKHTFFYLGKTKVNVSFTGGIVTKKGVTPATFTTDDPIVQLAIEQSEDFKKGNIKIRSKYLMDGEVNIGHNPEISRDIPQEGNEAGTSPERLQEIMEGTDSEMEGTDSSPEQLQKIIEETDSEMEETEEEIEEMEEEKGLEVIEVSCKDVAKQYLQEHYGENPAPLRTRDAVQECAAKYGITFNFV